MWHLLMNLSYFMAANMISDNFGHGCPDVSVNPWSGLTCCGLATRYGGINLGQHRTRNGLLPDGTKPLPESKLTQWGLVPFTWRQFHKCSLLDKRWKIANLRLELHLPLANELTVLSTKMFWMKLLFCLIFRIPQMLAWFGALEYSEPFMKKMKEGELSSVLMA